MRTRCPACGTTFRITAEQLKHRQGRVRCGRCERIFNAVDALVDEAWPTTVMPLPPVPAEPLVAPRTPVEPEPAPPAEPAWASAVEPEPGQAVTPSAVPAEAEAGASSQAEPRRESAAEPLPASWPASWPEAETDTQAKTEPKEEEPPREPEQRTPEPQVEAPPPAAAARSPEADSSAPRSTERAARTRKSPAPRSEPPLEPMLHETPERSRSWLWWLATLQALVVLAAQAGIIYRVELAALHPDLRPLLAAACEQLGCDMPLPSQARLVDIVASELNPDVAVKGRLRLMATVKNRAPYAQQYPDLELTLIDQINQPLARRVLTPAEYLPPGVDVAAGFPAQSETAVSLSIDASAVQASGYLLYLFYP